MSPTTVVGELAVAWAISCILFGNFVLKSGDLR